MREGALEGPLAAWRPLRSFREEKSGQQVEGEEDDDRERDRSVAFFVDPHRQRRVMQKKKGVGGDAFPVRLDQ